MMVEVCGCYDVLLRVYRSEWCNMGESVFV